MLNLSQFTNLIYVKVRMCVRTHMQIYESNLRVVELWKFLSDIQILWPWPTDLFKLLDMNVFTCYR